MDFIKTNLIIKILLNLYIWKIVHKNNHLKVIFLKTKIITIYNQLIFIVIIKNE